MPEEAVLDAPVDVAPVSDAPEPTSSPSEPADSPEPTSETPDPATPEPAAPEAKGLSEQDKAALAEIQKQNPALAGRLRRALFAEQQFRAVAPGGLKEVREMRQTIEQIGGAEGLQRIQAERAEQAQLDSLLASADPKIFDHIGRIAPEALPKLLSAALGQFEKTQPVAHAAHVTQTVLADMQAHDIPLTMALLGRMIGENPEAKQLFGQVSGYLARLKQLSEQKDEPAAAKDPQGNDFDQQKQKFEQEKEQFTRNEWKTSASQRLKQLYDGSLNDLLKGRKITDEQRASIAELTQLRLQRKWDADGGLRSQLDKIFANKDRAAYDRISASHYKQDVPEVLRQVCKHILPAKPGPVAAAAPVNGAPKPVATGATAEGYVRVAKSPDTNEINYHPTHGTTNAMYAQGRAVLKSGKKVQWK